MGQRLGRWQQVLVDALAEHDAVGVRSVVENHLGRQPTRGEITAARRAAHLLERDGRAGIEHVRPPSGVGRGIWLVVLRPCPAPADTADTADNFDDQAQGDGPVVRWVEVTSHVVGSAGPRFGRWQRVIIDALAEHDAVGLRAVVEGHLNRKATQVESVAAHRAAHLLARGGRAKLARVKVPTANGRKGGILLVIVRPDLAPADVPDESALQVTATRYVAPTKRTREALQAVVASLQAAAASIEEIQLQIVNEAQAREASQAMALPLRELTQLRQSLIMHRP